MSLVTGHAREEQQSNIIEMKRNETKRNDTPTRYVTCHHINEEPSSLACLVLASYRIHITVLHLKLTTYFSQTPSLTHPIFLSLLDYNIQIHIDDQLGVFLIIVIHVIYYMR